jgi:4-hydroxy-tetrahydrodipicolinate reductase
MNVLLVGYGRMGRLLEERLLEKGHVVTAVVDPFLKAQVLPSGVDVYTSLKDALTVIKDVDAAIEFTLPGSAAENILFFAGKKIPVVSGTTGWYDKLPEISEAVEASGSSLLWASNFSLGINLFYRIASYTAKLTDPFKDYDVAGFEIHHNNKADSPSGTAKTLVEGVLAQMTGKKKAVYEMLDRRPEKDELHYASLRVGSVPGTHSLIFDSAADSIEITHTARSREGFANGAILATEWLCAKKRTGIFTINDVLADILP